MWLCTSANGSKLSLRLQYLNFLCVYSPSTLSVSICGNALHVHREHRAVKPFWNQGLCEGDPGSMSDVWVLNFRSQKLFITTDDNLISMCVLFFFLASCPDSITMSSYLCNLSHCWQWLITCCAHFHCIKYQFFG